MTLNAFTLERIAEYLTAQEDWLAAIGATPRPPLATRLALRARVVSLAHTVAICVARDAFPERAAAVQAAREDHIARGDLEGAAKLIAPPDSAPVTFADGCCGGSHDPG